MWVIDRSDRKLYAYNLSSKARDRDKDLNGLNRGQLNPAGLWGYDSIMWVTDDTKGKVYAYNIRSTVSDDATLSNIVVSPKNIVGFRGDYGVYEVGVASTVTEATVVPTTNHPAATAVFGQTDTNSALPGHQVLLQPGRNTVTITSTAEDASTTASYTIYINRGVNDPYGWKASDDLDGLAPAGSTRPRGIWGNGTTFWVSDNETDHIYAFNADGTRNASQDFDTLDSDNRSAGAIWSDGITMWVVDFQDDEIYAYNLSTKARDRDKYFTTLFVYNTDPSGIWSDGDTMWVSDTEDEKIYAYNMSTKNRDTSKEFPSLAGSDDATAGIWSDGITMWVANFEDDKIFAYRMSNNTRDSDRDFNTLGDAGNTGPSGLWGSGQTLWVVDQDDEKVYSYNMPLSNNATLSALTVSPRNIIGFQSTRTTYEVGVASTVTTATVTPTRSDSDATVAITPADANAGTGGHQVALSAGRNTVTVTVTAADGVATASYTIYINRGVNDPYGWKASDDLDGLVAAGNRDPGGVWSDGSTFWVADLDDGKIYAYHANGMRNAGQDFDTLGAAGNTTPLGIWSDHTTMWVVDNAGQKIYAYNMSTKARDTSREFNTLDDAGNTGPGDIWSDGITMWVTDPVDLMIYAYNMSTKARDTSREFNTLDDAGNADPTGIWSDGITMWVADYVDNRIYAYNMSTKARDTSREFDSVASTNSLVGYLWSDRETMWVIEEGTPEKAYSYNMPPPDEVSDDPPMDGDPSNNRLESLTFSPKNIIGFDADRTRYFLGLHPEVEQVTVTAEPQQNGATVTYDPADADPNTPGIQVNLADGTNEYAIKVTPRQGSSKTYTVHITRGSDEAGGHNAGNDLNGLEAAGNTYAQYIWSDHTTMWTIDPDDKKVYAYRLTEGVRVTSQEFALHADNEHPGGIWSDGSIMWVADSGDDKLYAYRLSNGSRRTSQEFSLDPANGNPTGIWSDGETIWVVNEEDANRKIYAYQLSDGQRLTAREINLDQQIRAISLWSDGTTMWVSDLTSEKIFAYRLEDGTRKSTRDISTSYSRVFHEGPYGIWSNGATMWVSFDKKVYAYNLYDHSSTIWIRNMGRGLFHFDSLNTPGPGRLDVSYRSNLPIRGARQGPRLETIIEKAQLMSMVIGETYENPRITEASGMYHTNITQDCGLLHQSFTSACRYSFSAGRNPGQPIPGGAGNDIDVIYDGSVTAIMLLTVYEKPVQPDGLNDRDRERRTVTVLAPSGQRFTADSSRLCNNSWDDQQRGLYYRMVKDAEDGGGSAGYIQHDGAVYCYGNAIYQAPIMVKQVCKDHKCSWPRLVGTINRRNIQTLNGLLSSFHTKADLIGTENRDNGWYFVAHARGAGGFLPALFYHDPPEEDGQPQVDNSIADRYRNRFDFVVFTSCQDNYCSRTRTEFAANLVGESSGEGLIPRP